LLTADCHFRAFNPAGKATFGIMGVFAEFKRAMIQERVRAGLARAKWTGKTLGRPKTDAATEKAIRAALKAGDVGCTKSPRRSASAPRRCSASKRRWRRERPNTRDLVGIRPILALSIALAAVGTALFYSVAQLLP
jgi:DNA invertase Pin-like site-specific DNA recombinase